MKKILTDFLTFILFGASITCFYFAFTTVFSTALFNLLLLFFAVFLLIQAAGLIDQAKGFGQYADDNKPDNNNPPENQNES